jgi:hypothetical protein
MWTRREFWQVCLLYIVGLLFAFGIMYVAPDGRARGEIMSLDAYWETPLGPYDNANVGGKIIIDTEDDYAYWIGQDSADDVKIIKIVRSTFTVDSSATFTGKEITFNHSAEQDATHLYVGIDDGNKSYIKIAKTDLSLVDTGDAPSGVIFGPESLHMGVTATWSAGLLWGVVYSTDTPIDYHHLVAWNPATGSVSHNTLIPHADIGGEDQAMISRIQFDSNGDCWITSAIQGPTLADQDVVLIKATGPSTFASPIELNGVVNAGAYEDGIAYDAATHSLILTNRSPDPFTAPELSNIARYDITGATVTYNTNYDGLHMADGSGMGVSGNGMRDILGYPAVFAGWHDPNDWDGPSTIVFYNHITGALVTAMPMQTGYGWPHNLVLDPEGGLWMTSGADDSGPTAGQEHIHKLNLATALETVRGYVSWAEMEMPGAEEEGFLRPTYGRGYGRGYGDSHG